MEAKLELINKAALKFLSPHSSQKMYSTIVNEGKNLFDAKYGSIFLEQNGKLERVFASAPFLNIIKIRKNGFTYRTLTRRLPYVVKVDKIPNFGKDFIEHKIRSIIHIPLSYKGRSIGVLTLHMEQLKELSVNDLHILKLFGSMASLAIKKTQLYKDATDALEIRDLFISLASHELRTPLTSINGYIQLLQNRMKDKDTVESKWVHELYQESERLTNLVKELLEVNRIKQGEFQYELKECNLSEVINKSIDRFHFRYPNRKIVWDLKIKENEDTIIGDSNKLLQMIDSLLSNAAKFSPENSMIVIHLRTNKKYVILQVVDQGVGIARQDFNKIFEGFYKGTQRHKEGIGLGLVLAKHVIQYHHGNISIKSEENRGTTIEVQLPKTTLTYDDN